jgi:hypothetical protein
MLVIFQTGVGAEGLGTSRGGYMVCGMVVTLGCLMHWKQACTWEFGHCVMPTAPTASPWPSVLQGGRR